MQGTMNVNNRMKYQSQAMLQHTTVQEYSMYTSKQDAKSAEDNIIELKGLSRETAVDTTVQNRPVVNMGINMKY